MTRPSKPFVFATECREDDRDLVLPPIHISPDLILLIFLPALLFEAAWNLKLDRLKANPVPILSLAVVGVIFSVGMIALILHFGSGLSWSAALLFGSIVSATDPVSVLALFKKLGAPKRLTVILEGERVFNDGTAVVVFRIILGVVIGVTGLDSPGANRQLVNPVRNRDHWRSSIGNSHWLSGLQAHFLFRRSFT